MAHQAVSLEHNDRSPIVFDTSDPGTGKTFVRITAYAKRRAKGAGCMLVLAPRSLLRSVWLNDIKKFAPDLKVSVADAANREAAFAEDADVYVTNVDAAKWLAAQKPTFFKKFTEFAVDESTAFKNHTSARSKAMAKIAQMKNFTHRCCMTGTPNGRSITDVWHQVFLLDGGARLGNSFYRFREAVCAPKQVGRDPNAIHWTDKEGAEEVVFGLLADIVIRHKFEDCVDIPPNHRYSVGYELTSKQRRAYDEMENTQMLLLEKSNDMVLAINAASVATKLQQIASGAVYDGQGGYALIDTARYEMILDLVEQRKHSLVLFLWQHQRNALLAEADKRGITFAVIDGSTSDRERHEIVQGYQAGAYQVLFGHPKTIAHGFTLTRGTTTIWASPTYDTELDAQGSKRQHRIGQTEKTETITIVAQGTIDEKVHAMMTEKRGRMLNLLDLFGTLNRPAVPRETTKRKAKEAI